MVDIAQTLIVSLYHKKGIFSAAVAVTKEETTLSISTAFLLFDSPPPPRPPQHTNTPPPPLRIYFATPLCMTQDLIEMLRFIGSQCQ